MEARFLHANLSINKIKKIMLFWDKERYLFYYLVETDFYRTMMTPVLILKYIV